MRRIVPLTLAALVLALAAAPARGATYRFQGDLGTSCAVEVGAKASDSLGALSGPPQVGYSAVPSCEYPTPSQRRAARKRIKRCAAQKRHGKRPSKRCKRRKKQAKPRAAATPAPATPAASEPTAASATPLALLDAGRLELLSPAGVADTGDATMASAGLGGYSCALGTAAYCADSGRLIPAVPGTPYFAEFSLKLAPPAGESWISTPGGCSAAPAPECALRSATVTPRI